MIVQIKDGFREQGLTLEETYILNRVKFYDDEDIPYIESNLTLAKIMGKSESTVRRAINNLILKGFLNKRTVGRTRVLSTSHIERNSVHEECNSVHTEHNSVHNDESPLKGMTAEEQARRLQELINETRDPNFDITEEMY